MMSRESGKSQLSGMTNSNSQSASNHSAPRNLAERKRKQSFPKRCMWIAAESSGETPMPKRSRQNATSALSACPELATSNRHRTTSSTPNGLSELPTRQKSDPGRPQILKTKPRRHTLGGSDLLNPYKRTSRNTIKEILRQPAVEDADTGCSVSSIVNNIVSQANPAGKQSHKYLIVPLVQTSPAADNEDHVRQYILINSLDDDNQPTGSQQQTDSTSGYRQPATNSKRRGQPVCTAVISATVDTVSKWLACNRDILTKTLEGVAEKLGVRATVRRILAENVETIEEQKILKWVAITLLLLTKRRILQSASKTGTSIIPGNLYSMWNNLRSFFTVFEGCLLLAKKSRVNGVSKVELNQEDNVFEIVVDQIFSAYTSAHNEYLPIPQDLKSFCQFLEALHTRKPSYRVGCRNNITSILTTGPSTSARFN